MIKILITGVNYFGGNTLIKELKKLDDRFYFIGVDINPNSAAQFYCDKFYEQKDFDQSIIIERPDLILPATSVFIPFASRIGKIMASDPTTTITCLSKTNTYKALKGVIPLPEYINCPKGYWHKIDRGKGGRDMDYYQGYSRFMIEHLEGEQIDVDVLSLKGKLLLAMCKVRERVYGGTLVEGEIVDRPKIVAQIEKALKFLPLSYLSVWQFIGGELLEINPRCAGMIFYPPDWNIVWLAIKLALGEISPKQIKEYNKRIPYSRRVARYLEQYEYEK